MNQKNNENNFTDKNLEQMIKFFKQNKVCLMYGISDVGNGKTLFLALTAYYYSKIYSNNSINCNYLLNLPNFQYNPYSFYPYGKLNDTLIQIDDCINVLPVDKIIKITANTSRKLHLILQLTAQYKKFVSLPIRTMSKFLFECHLTDLVKDIDGNDILSEKSRLIVELIGKSPKFESRFLIFYDVLDIVEKNKLFDTNEIVKIPIDKYIVKEILDYSKNLDDILCNLESYYSKTNAIKFYKKLREYRLVDIKKAKPNRLENILYGIKNKKKKNI